MWACSGIKGLGIMGSIVVLSGRGPSRDISITAGVQASINIKGIKGEGSHRRNQHLTRSTLGGHESSKIPFMSTPLNECYMNAGIVERRSGELDARACPAMLVDCWPDQAFSARL